MDRPRDYYVIFETPAGWIGLQGSEAGLSQATLPQQSEEQASLMLGNRIRGSIRNKVFFQAVIGKYLAYFQGRKVDFAESLDLVGRTPFEKAVWKTTLEIPYGKTQSYSDIARQIGKPSAPRAAGQALGRNPLAIIIPCHRVLAIDGSLGGYGGGLELKRRLLDLEAGNYRF
jgi:O-6-methylguanine DNA methyltransferase